MENNEMIFEEAMDSMIEVDTTEVSGSKFGAGKTMLLVAGVALAVTAAVKLGKKAWNKHKAKKELRRVDENDIVEVTDEQITEVTK